MERFTLLLEAMRRACGPGSRAEWAATQQYFKAHDAKLIVHRTLFIAERAIGAIEYAMWTAVA